LAVAQYGNYALILSIISLLYGSIIAITQNNMKRLIAYSSFAHVGLMSAGVFTKSLNGLQGVMIQMLAHGINAVGLFFIVKIIFDRTGTRNLDALGGITQKARNLTIAFIIIMLGSVALPLTNGFTGEFLLLKSVYNANTWLGVLAGLTIILGAVYMLRMVQKSMFGETNEVTALFKDISGSEVLTLLPLVIMVILMGVFPNVFLKITEPAIQHLLEISK
jgi:NADH-quinone oxidoreductase subunit M